MTPRRRGGPLAALAAGAVAAGALHLAMRSPAALRRPWERTNFSGVAVTLAEGPAVVLGALTGVIVLDRRDLPALLVVLGAGGVGAVDDLVGDRGTKGFAGHLRALRSGRVTTGAAKIFGIGASALLATLLDERSAGLAAPASPGGRTSSRRRLVRAADVGVGTVLIAGSANLVNLFDLRPGRALKVTTTLALASLPGGGPRSAAWALLGAGTGVLRPDLAGKSMLGDCGAGALGGLGGLVLRRRLDARGRLVAAALVTAATLASERVSFTRVIEATPVLREIDAWGRSARP